MQRRTIKTEYKSQYSTDSARENSKLDVAFDKQVRKIYGSFTRTVVIESCRRCPGAYTILGVHLLTLFGESTRGPRMIQAKPKKSWILMLKNVNIYTYEYIYCGIKRINSMVL